MRGICSRVVVVVVESALIVVVVFTSCRSIELANFVGSNDSDERKDGLHECEGVG